MRILKLTNTIFILAISAVMLHAQDTAVTATDTTFTWIMDNIFLLFGGIIILWVVHSLLSLSFGLLSVQKAKVMKDIGLEKEEIVQELSKPMWKRMYDWAWSIVPIAQESDIDLGHDYDGIRELDNRLPPWWLVLFYGSIVFALVYMYAYHRPSAEWSSEQEYLMAMADAEEQKKSFLASSMDAVDETTVTLLEDDESIARGADLYIALCAVCHGQQGEGLVGPNFTDPYWIHGGGVKNIFSTIKYGVPEKGMISWKSQLRPSEMQSLASYILTLEGTNPPNQKAQEGDLWTASEAEVNTETDGNSEI